MGNSVQVSYVNGVAIKEVKKITNKYRDGYFNSMTDSYIYTPDNGLPRAKYITIRREYTDEAKAEMLTKMVEKYRIEDVDDDNEWLKIFGMLSGEAVRQELRDIAI